MTLLQRISTIIDHATLSTAIYTPKGAYTGKLPSKTVKKGSKGTDAKRLQTFLNWCGASLKVDGNAGSKTISALKKWQKAYGLKADGVFGSKSRAKAKAIVKQYAQPTPSPAPAPTPSPTPAPAPTPTYYPTANALKIVDRATAYAWPSGTSSKKSSYKKGSARSSYKSALKKYMGKKKKASQSDCGYFVATCVRAAGLGSSFKALPGSYKSKYPKVPSTFSIVLKGKKIPSGFLLPGDIIRYRKKGGQHTLLYMGSGKIAHAGRNNWFPKIVGNSKSYNKSNVKTSSIQVLRAK